MFLTQFLEEFLILRLAEINGLAVFDQVGGLGGRGLGVGVGYKKEKADYEKNNEIMKGEKGFDNGTSNYVVLC